MHSIAGPSKPSSDSQGPLCGVRVVALEHSVAGPLASRILAELGADVVKVERPGSGDFSRHWDESVAGEGAQFWWLNRLKRSLALDVKSEAGARSLDALIGDADVLIHNLAPPSAARLGLDAETLAARHPALINCQISGYGAAGPASTRKAYDMLVQAEAGVMSLTGTPEQPTRVGVSISDVSTGIYSALLILGALLEREQTGVGRSLDVAMLDVTLEFLGPMLTSFLNAGTIYPRIPDQHHAIAPYGVFRCGDGERILIAIEQDDEWRRFCREVLGDRQLSDDDRYATNLQRLERRPELAEEISRRFAGFDSATMLAALSNAGLAYAQVNDAGAVAAHPVVAHRGIVVDGETADEVTISHLRGLAERLFQRTGQGRDRPPALGEDNEDVLGSVDIPEDGKNRAAGGDS